MPSSDYISVDPLFHLGYTFPGDTGYLYQIFSQTRFVLLCGSTSRAKKLAAAFSNGPHTNYCRTDRFAVFSPVPHVTIASHGMGLGSVDILLHEMHKLLAAVNVDGYTIIRVGSCGGVGVPAGSVVITKRALNEQFEPSLRVNAVGEVFEFPAKLDEQVSAELFKKGEELYPGDIVNADTLCAMTFYVAQGRLDGAFAMGNIEDRKRLLTRCRDHGVVNLEMESLAVAAFAARVGVKAAVVCAVLVNRLSSETPTQGKETLQAWEERAVRIVVEYVKQKLTV